MQSMKNAKIPITVAVIVAAVAVTTILWGVQLLRFAHGFDRAMREC